jgi:uncharacterized linocin/CFP29 family protein
MANKYLARDGAPFESAVWELLDATMQEAAKSQLVGRRILDTEGPYGLGLKAVPLADGETESGLIASQVLPVFLIQESFTLGTRDIASYERDRLALDTGPVAEAAIECARLEDELIFHGAPNMPGLLAAAGSSRIEMSSWEEIGAAANDAIQAMTQLDNAGFHGPYSLALAPQRYNLLFRLYPRGKQTELEHLRTMITEGIYKAPILESGGLLLAANARCASIVLGQDMSVGYIGPAENRQEFSISESLAVRIRRPEAICILEG